MKVFVLQLLNQLMLLAGNLVKNATMDLTLTIAEEISAKLYERFRNPCHGRSNYWIWPFKVGPGDKLDNHLALAISRLFRESCSAEKDEEDELNVVNPLES